METEAIIEKTNTILSRITEIDAERKSLLDDLMATIPIKIGDKVGVMKHNIDGEDEERRFAFVDKIEVFPRGKERQAKLEFSLVKCKKDGTKSEQSDRLFYGEYIIPIKKLSLNKAISKYPIGTKFTSLFGVKDEVTEPKSGKTHYVTEDGSVMVYGKNEYRLIYNGSNWWADINN